MLSRKWKLDQEEAKLAEEKRKLEEARAYRSEMITKWEETALVEAKGAMEEAKKCVVLAKRNVEHQEEIEKKAIWELTHPLLDAVHEHIPLDLALICVSYIAGGWCIYHRKLHLGSECLHCMTPFTKEASWWQTCGNFVVHSECLSHDCVMSGGYRCITPTTDDDKLLVKEWMDIKIHREGYSDDFQCWNNAHHRHALRIVLPPKEYTTTTIEPGTYLKTYLPRYYPWEENDDDIPHDYEGAEHYSENGWICKWYPSRK